MERYANGDDSAFADLYDEIAPLLSAALSETTNSQTRIESIVESTFDHLRRRRGTFARGGEAVLWAQAIAGRLLADSIARDFKQARIAAKWVFDAVERSLPAVEEIDLDLARVLSRTAVASLSSLFDAERESGALRKRSLRRAEVMVAELRALVGDIRSRSGALRMEAAHDTLLLQQRVGVLVQSLCRPEALPPAVETEPAPVRRWWRRAK